MTLRPLNTQGESQELEFTTEERFGGVMTTFALTQVKSRGVSEGVSELKSLIARRPGLRTPALAETMSTSPKNVERWLKQLKIADQVEFVGSPKTGGYFLVSKES